MGQVLIGDSAANVLNGGSGDDVLVGNGGGDTLNGGAGRDTVDYSRESGPAGVRVDLLLDENFDTFGARDSLSSIEVVVGTARNDDIRGDFGANELFGGDGDDLLSGRGGGDRLVGGSGDDTYLLEGDGLETIVEEVGGGNADRVRSYQAVTTLAANVEILEGIRLGDQTLTGTNANDVIRKLYTGQGTLSGLGGDDTIVGGSGVDLIDGGLGDDQLAGGSGADTLYGDAGEDTARYDLDGGGGFIDANLATRTAKDSFGFIDQLFGIENLTGGATPDALTGDDGDNKLSGLGGADVLQGGGGNDRLDGGAGADAMTGGTGDDTYVANSAADTVMELAGQGFDTVISSISWTLGANVEALTLTASGLTGTGTGGNNTLQSLGGGCVLVGGAGDDTYVLHIAGDTVVETAGGGFDAVSAAFSGYTLGSNLEALYLTGAAVSGFGNGTDNVLVGNASANLLAGGAGHDQLYGWGGADELRGGEGSDFLRGMDGDDVIYGDAGANTLWGEAGRDILLGGNEGETLSGGDDADQLYAGGGADSVQGDDGDDFLRGMDGVDWMRGGSGADVLIGDAGADVLWGDAGADRFVYLAQSDSVIGAADVLVDFQSGVDKIDFSALTAGRSVSWALLPAGGGYTALDVDFGSDGVVDMRLVLSPGATVAAGDLLF